MQLYRVCIKASTFQQAPTFRIRIGKSEKRINPYFIPSDKQRFNCDSILQRKNNEPELVLSVFYGYKFVGSGSTQFKKNQMPNQKMQIMSPQKQRIGFIDLSLMLINKVKQVPAIKLEVHNAVIEGIEDMNKTGDPFLVLKYGQYNYKTENLTEIQGNKYYFSDLFKCPASEMERILVQTWCQIDGQNKFLGVSFVYLKDKTNFEDNKIYDILFMNKKRGQICFSISQNKDKQEVVEDQSKIIKRTIKITVVEAILQDQIKGAYIKLFVGKQECETTVIHSSLKELSWNQSFTLNVGSRKQQMTAKLCSKESSQDQEGIAFLEISKISNRIYQLTLLDDKQEEIGKVYLEFYDHQLDVKEQVKKRKISKALADKISSDLEAIRNRYKNKQSLHEYMQNLHAVLQEGLLKVAKSKSQNPIKELGNFLVQYRK